MTAGYSRNPAQQQHDPRQGASRTRQDARVAAHPVLILTGPPGAGKSTTARALAAQFERAVHLEADLFFSFVRAGFVEPWEPESAQQNDVVMRSVAAAASGYALGGYFVVVEGIVLPRWYLEPLSRWLADSGHDVAFAVLRAPLEVCAARVRDRPAQELSEASVVESLWTEFADLGPLEGHAIDVASIGAEEAATLLRRRLDDGSLALG